MPAAEHRASRLRAFVALVTLVGIGLVAAAPTAANSISATKSSTATFQPGDLFGVSGPHFNLVDWRHSDGSLVATLDPGFTGITPGGVTDPFYGWIGGMAFDPTGRLAVSGFLDNTLVRFAPDGTFLGTFIAQVGATDEAPCPLPTDITYGREGDLVVGDFGICASDNGAEWFDRNGVFKALVVPGEADGVDLDADQCTLFVADANDDVIYNTNICTGQPASPRFGIATAVDSPSVRVLPDGSVLFVDAFAPDYAIVQPGRYSRGGTLLATYGTGGCSHWSGVVPDVGGTAFWSNCSTTHSSTLFDVATGAVLRTLPGVVVDAVYGGFRSALARRGNRPPDCTTAQATPSTLSPADHEYQTVAFSGAVDPDNNPVTLTVTGVTQDEPIAGTGPGDRDPDAKRSSGTLLLRRERSDSGDGRVYRVTLRGADGKGGSCTTTVAVSVPLTAGGTAVDSGGSYNSFGA